MIFKRFFLSLFDRNHPKSLKEGVDFTGIALYSSYLQRISKICIHVKYIIFSWAVAETPYLTDLVGRARIYLATYHITSMMFWLIQEEITKVRYYQRGQFPALFHFP